MGAISAGDGRNEIGLNTLLLRVLVLYLYGANHRDTKAQNYITSSESLW